MAEIILPKGKRGQAYQDALKAFADSLIEIDDKMPNKVSSRGWCYIMEGPPFRVIDKSQFKYIEGLITNCRKTGYLPIDFVAMDLSRQFYCVELLTEPTLGPVDYLSRYLRWIRHIQDSKDDVAFWSSQEDYYVQLVSEKVDILNLFEPICEKYHIATANMKGWSDLNSRNEMAQRFKQAEQMGLEPVLLYYGDHDPDGLRIDSFLKKNLDDLKKGTTWNPKNLIVDRFGLNYDFIEAHNLLWIDNLKTGSGKDLASPTHPNHHLPYVQDYIKEFGPRKCEANAVLIMADLAKEYCEAKIVEYLGKDCFDKYHEKIAETRADTEKIMEKVDYVNRIDELLNDLNKLDEDE